eukprot:365287-Chlamydomonas_euryale.AAC.1
MTNSYSLTSSYSLKQLQPDQQLQPDNDPVRAELEVDEDGTVTVKIKDMTVLGLTRGTVLGLTTGTVLGLTTGTVLGLTTGTAQQKKRATACFDVFRKVGTRSHAWPAWQHVHGLHGGVCMACMAACAPRRHGGVCMEEAKEGGDAAEDGWRRWCSRPFWCRPDDQKTATPFISNATIQLWTQKFEWAMHIGADALGLRTFCCNVHSLASRGRSSASSGSAFVLPLCPETKQNEGSLASTSAGLASHAIPSLRQRCPRTPPGVYRAWTPETLYRGSTGPGPGNFVSR